MSEILRDPIWQFIAVIIALMTIPVSIILYWKQRRRKALSYEIVSVTPLLSIKEEIKGKMRILFENKPVQQVYLILVKITNSGNLPISPSDYERAISLSFGEKGKILTAEVVETAPSSLQTSARIEGEKVVLDSNLLNQGDLVKLKILMSEFDGQISVDGCIAGVKDIRESSKKFSQFTISVVIGMVLYWVGIWGMIQSSRLGLFWWTSLIVAFLGTIVLLIRAIQVLRPRVLI